MMARLHSRFSLIDTFLSFVLPTVGKRIIERVCGLYGLSYRQLCHDFDTAAIRGWIILGACMIFVFLFLDPLLLILGLMP